MQHKEEHFEGAAGARIYYQLWQPEASPRALVILVHGAGEHSARYQRLAERFTARGYVVAALDHVGHGKSAGTYGHLDDFDHHIHNVRALQQLAHHEFPDLPQVLLGHSMGGLIAANFLLEYQSEFAACVLSGPAIKTDLEPGWLQMTIIRLLAKFAPTAGVLQLDASGVSRDPEEVRLYQEDPLVHSGKFSARKVRELFVGMTRIQERAGEIRLPMLILHGGEDSLTTPAGSEFLAEAISSKDKTLTIYPGLYHEIFNEPEREQVFVDVLDWLEPRLPTQA